MANRMTAGPGTAKGVTFAASDPSFGLMPRNVADLLRSLHTVSYSEQTAGGVTTGTLQVPGFGQVAAFQVTDRPVGGRHGIDTLRLLDSHGQALVSIEGVAQPDRYASTSAALSAFLQSYAQGVQALYATGNTITGTSFADSMHGGAGADVLAGGGGNDGLFGDAGNDRIQGGAGRDHIEGGLGVDTLFGQSGADVFAFRSISESGRGALADTIDDFDARSDRIDLRGVDADLASRGNQAFHFIGQQAFGHHAGELHVAGSALQGDVNGDGVADFEVHFGSHSVLTGFTAADILL